MQFFDLKAQYQNIKKEIDEAVLSTLEGGIFIGGKKVEEFENKMAHYLGAKHAVSMNSGTDALYLALRSFGIGPGDEVVTTPFTFIATAETITACGAKPVFADIDPKTFNIDPEKFEKAVRKKTKTVIPVHLYGQMADMEKIMKTARLNKLRVIEDAAQAMGAKMKIGKKEAMAGTVGDIGCFSFFPTKNLGAFGDGGMAVTGNAAAKARLRLLKSHGSSPKEKYRHLELGVNSRLDAIQAAILSIKIGHLAEWNEKRNEIAQRYSDGLKGAGDVAVPYVAPGASHVFHQYSIRTGRRNRLREYLTKKGIPTMIHYPLPLHLQPAFKYLGYKTGDFPEAELAAREVLSLPMYPELEQKSQDTVIRAIKDFYDGKK